VAALTFEQARQCVLEQTFRHAARPGIENVDLLSAAGRVLAETVVADRDLPPFHRSGRDGFAVRAEDLPGALRVIGEVRAGEASPLPVTRGEAIEIMTGAPLPAGADAVLMVEHAVRNGGSDITTDRALLAGENVIPQGAEVRCAETVAAPGMRLAYPAIALLATVGKPSLAVYRKPQVAILPTGDELVGIREQPQPFQIRNSNAYSLAVQVARAGGEPLMLPVARDQWEPALAAIREGLKADLLLLSGGVSAGKYDIVENVLASLGAEFFFDRVLIQPGQPLVFGRAGGTLFFGLPGNPASTMVTFELFARAALEILSGVNEPSRPLLWTRVDRDFRHKPGLTRFLPARLSASGESVTPLSWHGSGDVPALTRANAYVVAESGREAWAAGDWIQVLQQ
jgi:molybdopterin molybdotransferase